MKNFRADVDIDRMSASGRLPLNPKKRLTTLNQSPHFSELFIASPTFTSLLVSFELIMSMLALLD